MRRSSAAKIFAGSSPFHAGRSPFVNRPSMVSAILSCLRLARHARPRSLASAHLVSAIAAAGRLYAQPLTTPTCAPAPQEPMLPAPVDSAKGWQTERVPKNG